MEFFYEIKLLPFEERIEKPLKIISKNKIEIINLLFDIFF